MGIDVYLKYSLDVCFLVLTMCSRVSGFQWNITQIFNCKYKIHLNTKSFIGDNSDDILFGYFNRNNTILEWTC